jgi:hypothetical protein
VEIGGEHELTATLLDHDAEQRLTHLFASRHRGFIQRTIADEQSDVNGGLTGCDFIHPPSDALGKYSPRFLGRLRDDDRIRRVLLIFPEPWRPRGANASSVCCIFSLRVAFRAPSVTSSRTL